jgi:PAS domain S-box-containing protein
MFTKLKAFLTPPVMPHENQASAAAILRIIILLTLLTLSIASLPTLMTTPNYTPVLLIFVGTMVFLVGLYIMVFRGYVKQISFVMVLGLGAIVTLANLLFHGPYSPGLGAYTVLILITGILLGRRAALIASVICVFIVLGISLALMLQLLPTYEEVASPLSRATVNSLYYILAALVLYIAIGLINDGVRRLRENEQKLTETLSNLQSTSFSKNYVDNILRSMNNLLVVMDSMGKIQTANPTVLKMLDYAEAELLGAPIQLIFEASAARDMTEDVTRTSESNFITKSGKRIPVSYTQAMMRGDNGTIEGVVLVAQDISERRAAEAERLRNAMRYRALFEQSNDAVFLLNLEGKHIATNQRAADLLGYAVHELLQMEFRELIVHHEQGKHKEVLETLRSGKTVPPYERTLQHKEGYEIPVEVSIQLVYDPDGKPMHIQSIVRDITERRQNEQRLSYQVMLLENVSDAIISTSMSNVIQSWNRAAETVYGWKAEEVIGKKLNEIVPTEFDNESEDFIRQQYIVRGYWRSEVLQRRRDGRKLYMSSSVAILRDSEGELVGTVAVNHDITARKQAEMELQAHLTQLSALRQVDVEINSSLKVEDVMQIALHGASLLSGADAGYILLRENGRLSMRQSIGRYKDLPNEPIEPKGVLARATQSHESEFVLHTKEDSDCALPETKAQIVLPFMSHGKLTGLMNLETTTPEEFSQEKLDFLRILSNRIAIALDNARLYEKVKNLEALKTDMIRIASHDLRNPVGVIKGYMEILREDLAPRIDENEKEYIETVRRSVTRVQNIISDILSLQRIEEMANNSGNDLIDMLAMVQRVVEESEEGAARKKHQLICNFTTAQLLVQADPAQMHEAMMNLVDNAMKYTPDGGEIQIRLCREGDSARFEVEDNGFGIPDEMQKELFQPFYRARSRETLAIEGTGLGLHLVRNIIERFGGKMRVESVYGKGSTFGFDVPVMPGT